MQKYILAEIAEFLHAELRGDAECIINSIASLDKAKQNQISFCAKMPGFASDISRYLLTTEAAAVILSPKDAERYSGNALLVPNPYLSYAKLTSLFDGAPESESGIHKTAVIGKSCDIHNSVSVAANCCIGNNVTVGKHSVIAPNCVIGDDVEIGNDCHLYPNVSIYHGVLIGNGVIIHSGAVLGADGFGMANDNGKWYKIHQLGGVRVGNDVEIGANTCIDRGALEDTVIGDGVKLDNQIQIGHNVKIGEHTIIAGCVAIAGSTSIGEYCMIGGGTSFNGHISIADRTVITGASVVGRSITDPGVYSSAVTVQPHRKWMKTVSRLLQLDDVVGKLYKSKRKIT
jgi:UDP-3-O-[3-hydroxymyristoyl] glucosamine N-acyltransferase